MTRGYLLAQNLTLGKKKATSKMVDISNVLFVDLQQQNAPDVLGALKAFNELTRWTTTTNNNENKDEQRENANKANDLGAVGTIVGMLTKWQDNEEILFWAINAMDDLMSKNPKAAELFVKAKGLTAVVNIMKKYSKNCDIQNH